MRNMVQKILEKYKFKITSISLLLVILAKICYKTFFINYNHKKFPIFIFEVN